MSEKVKVHITMNKEVVKKAKELGLNISKISENAIKQYIEKLEHSTPIKVDTETYELLMKESERTGQPITDIIQQAIDTFIEKSTFEMLQNRGYSSGAISEIEKWYL